MEVRQVKPDELSMVYMMGYDVWSDSQSPEKYISNCASSGKYNQGSWQVLFDEGKLLSSLIIYTSGFNIPENYCGIGSIATDPNFRNTGYACFLIDAVCQSLEERGFYGVYLHSDIGAYYYERLGFTVISTTNSTCMLRKFQNTFDLMNVVPSYF